MVNDIERQDLGIVMALAYAAFVFDLREALKKAGYDDVHPSFGYVARSIADEPLTLRELAARLRISSPGALKIVVDLERTKYAQRTSDPSDARAVRVQLTKRGRSALAKARAFHKRYEAALARKHGKKAVVALRKVLEDIIAKSKEPNARSVRPI